MCMVKKPEKENVAKKCTLRDENWIYIYIYIVSHGFCKKQQLNLLLTCILSVREKNTDWYISL